MLSGSVGMLIQAIDLIGLTWTGRWGIAQRGREWGIDLSPLELACVLF